MFIDENLGKIDMKALDKGIKKLAAQTSRYLHKQDFELLKILKEANENGEETSFDGFEKLIKNLIVMEYNDGTYKRVNPIVA